VYNYKVTGAENAQFSIFTVCARQYHGGRITITSREGQNFQSDLQYIAAGGTDQFYKERRFLGYSNEGVKDTSPRRTSREPDSAGCAPRPTTPRSCSSSSRWPPAAAGRGSPHRRRE